MGRDDACQSQGFDMLGLKSTIENEFLCCRFDCENYSNGEIMMRFISITLPHTHVVITFVSSPRWLSAPRA